MLPMRFDTVTEWLDWQETLNPKEIDLGLDRVQQVAQRLNLLNPGYKIISVAGTNGKGSCVAMLSAMYVAAGYAVATYTSPHLFRYQERIQLNNQAIDDASLLAAFQHVDDARQNIPLTYFEFGTLAALLIFENATIDLAILEVGLGGRLDAVNVMDADVAVISSIDIDHVEWLGSDRSTIAAEKLGIARSDRPIVCGDPNPPAIIETTAKRLHAPLDLSGRDFSYRESNEESHEVSDDSWSWAGRERQFQHLSKPALVGIQQLQNAATCLAVTERLSNHFELSREHINQGLETVNLAGRFQVICQYPQIICDVAHNPHNVAALAANLLKLKDPLNHNSLSKHNFLLKKACLSKHKRPGRVLAVFGIMKDKDIAGVIDAIASEIQDWYIAALQSDRSASLLQLNAQMTASTVGQWQGFDSVAEALKTAIDKAEADDTIIVFGSFQTVAEACSISAETCV